MITYNINQRVLYCSYSFHKSILLDLGCSLNTQYSDKYRTSVITMFSTLFPVTTTEVMREEHQISYKLTTEHDMGSIGQVDFTFNLKCHCEIDLTSSFKLFIIDSL